MYKKHKVYIISIICTIFIFAIGFFSGNSLANSKANKRIDQIKKEYLAKAEEVVSKSNNNFDKLPVTEDFDNVYITLKKAEQDNDSLKLYVNYKNKSGKKVLTDDCLTKLIYNDEIQNYDSKFNFDKYYGKKEVVHAPDVIENNQSFDCVIFYKPIQGSKINIVFNCNEHKFKFDNIKVLKV